MTIKVAILTISDKASQGERADESGPALRKSAEENNFEVSLTKIIPDERDLIATTLLEIADSGNTDLILTTGGTGFSPRDVTPEATKDVIEKETPGISEMIRAESAKITPRAYLSRAISGIRNKTLIINLPGSPKGAVESFEIASPLLQHAIDVLTGQVHECAKIDK